MEQKYEVTKSGHEHRIVVKYIEKIWSYVIHHSVASVTVDSDGRYPTCKLITPDNKYKIELTCTSIPCDFNVTTNSVEEALASLTAINDQGVPLVTRVYEIPSELYHHIYDTVYQLKNHESHVTSNGLDPFIDKFLDSTQTYLHNK